MIQLSRFAGRHKTLSTEERYKLVDELVQRYTNGLRFGKCCLRFVIATFFIIQHINNQFLGNEIVFLWNRTLVAFVDKLSSTTVDFIRSEGELKNCALYGF